MNPAIYICLFLPIFIAMQERRKHKIIAKKRIACNKRGKRRMNEIVKNYIDKSCLLTTMDSTVKGVIKRIEGNWIIVDNGKVEEAVNLDFVTRIRPVPNKKG